MVQDYVEAAQVRGEKLAWVVFQEVLPNVAIPLVTDFGVRFVFVMLFISGLSFLGLGAQPPASDWGAMIRENIQGLSYGEYAALWPATAIASLTLAINLIVDDFSALKGGELTRQMG
jgi:peptide/nickel transport system permease protein